MGGAAKAYTTEPSRNMLKCLMRLSRIFTPLTDDLPVRSGKKHIHRRFPFIDGLCKGRQTLVDQLSIFRTEWNALFSTEYTAVNMELVITRGNDYPGIRTSRLLQRSTA